MPGDDDQRVPAVDGSGVPIYGDDVDTDQILPARFMKETSFENMADYLFYDARRDDDGELNDHPLNRFEDAEIAVVNQNFGMGSSREHAPQAMLRWGIEGIVGESFAEIFRDNCKSLGIPAATADHETVTSLQQWVEDHPQGDVHIDVQVETVTYGETTVDVDIDDAMQDALLQGIWDTTALMQSNAESVRETVAGLPYVEDE
jgi:3-isopropylmalate/(R)-2-methylmalate dehydratase small subunit